MCGIYGTNIPFEVDKIQSKLNLIKFRGPDNLGILRIGNTTLGHLRLAIIDLEERSNQPMAIDDLCVVFNGEIYNFKSIKQELISFGHQFNTTSDTEVLLYGYKQWGRKLVPRLNGMFAFCIYDLKEEKVFCARDRLGVKPFYYYWKDGMFEICSQLRPISENKKISAKSISIFLDCGYIPSPYSIYKDVYKLPPGNTMTIDLKSKELQTEEYWNLQKVSLQNTSYEDAKSELHALLTDCVKIRLQSDVPIGSFLSGGIDSALVSAIAAKISDKPINTFSIGFEDPKYDESKIAGQYAKIIDSHHTEIICKPEDVINLIPKLVEVYDEPFADSSALPSLLLNSVTKQYVTVALSGDGGDESFLGYNHFESVIKFIKFDKIPKQIRSLALRMLQFKTKGSRANHLKRVLQIKNINDFIEAIFVGYDSLQINRDKNWLEKYKNYKRLSSDPVQKAADLNIKLWLENDSNVKVDRASMAYSVEVRSPFLDYRIIEFARTLPLSYRYQKGIRKKILRDILREYIPEDVFDQPKKGFSVPLGDWMRNELKEEFVSNLSDDFLEIVPNLNVSKFKKMFQHHLEGKQDYTFNIWKVYVLSKWYQEFGFYQKRESYRDTLINKEISK